MDHKSTSVPSVLCYPYIYPGWDHTENEDKLLLAHASRMGQDMGTVIYSSDEVRNLSGICCNVGNMGTGDGLISLNTEYGKHLSTVVLNSVNHIQVLLYDLIPTSLSTLCIYLSSIDNSIFKSLKLLASTKDILCDIHSVIISNSHIIIISQFKLCLNNTTSKLKDLHKEMLNLSDSYGYINHLKNQLQTIIGRIKDTNNLNSKLSQIIEKFKCSLSEFGKIESCIKCVKSKIHEIIQTKNQLLTLTIIIATKFLDSFYFKIKCCCDNIDRISLLICEVEFYTCRLKYWICKFINLDISNNPLSRFLFTDRILETDIDEICSLINRIYSCICKISNICNSNCTCKCTCQCVTKCTSCTICLCICNSTEPKGSNGCCICICKKGTCKCICICVCETGESCCCNTGTPHMCNKCIFKVDLSRLRNDTWRILCHLRFIRCYIQIINKKCCYCSCCVNGRCDGSCCEPCQSITEYYKSIMSRIHWVETLSKRVGQKILELTKMNYSLSFYSTKANSCNKCDCCNKIKDLIKIISTSSSYYYKFGSRIKDIRTFVYYKLNYNRSNQIISSLEKSINPLLKNLKLINSQIQTNVYHTKMLEQLIMSVMSRTMIDESIFVISRLYVYYKTKDLIDETLQILNRCICVRIYNRDWRDKIQTFDKPLPNVNTRYYSPTIISLMMTHIINDGNYMCLCLVVRYILLNDLYVLIRYNEHLYMDLLSCMSRSYKKYSYSMTHNFNVSKLIMLIITTMDKIIRWMKNKFIGYKDCYCYDVNNSYYPYLISIILYVSSLIENIWNMDSQSITLAIDYVSSLLSEYQSIHVYTNYYSPSRHTILRNMISGLGSGKLIQGTLSHSGGIVRENTKSPLMFNSRLSLTTTLTGKEEKMTIFGTIADKRIGLFEDSLKCGFMSFRSMIVGTQFSRERFTLIYNKFSWLCYSCQSKINVNLDLTNIYANIPLKYLEEICKKETCGEKCCKVGDGLCKICPIAKIRKRCLSISFKDMGLIMANVSGDMLLNYLIESVDRSRDFITNLCVGFGEVYTIMLKNPLINSDPVLRSYGNTGITNVETRNWGYDTKYEHHVSTDRGFSNQNPYVSNMYGTCNKKFKKNIIKLNIP